MMSFKIIILLLTASLQVSCCRQSFSYPVIFDVTKIEVVNGANVLVAEIKDGAQIDRIVKFVDDRRSLWCSPRFGSLPKPEAMLYLYINNDGRSIIGFGDGFFVAEFSGGKYKMDMSGEEEQQFLKLLGVWKEQVLGK